MNDTNNNNDKGDDAETMRLAFEAFMLTGKTSANESKNDDSPSLATASSLSVVSNKSKKKKKKNKSSLGGVSAAVPSGVNAAGGSGNASSSPTPNQSTKAKSDKKRYYQLLRSFNDKVQNTWFDLDDQLASVLQNIVSIRGRLPFEWKLLHSSATLKRDNVPEQEEEEEEDLEEWKHHGLLGKPKELPYSFHLHTQDVELALSHDLTQHEKMLAGVRSLMSNLADCHEALGRVLDTLWKFHLECCTQGDEEGGNDGWMTGEGDMQSIVDCVTDLFQMLSMELYRKQSLVPLILESTDDEILGIEKGGGKGSLGSGCSDGNGLGGLQTAQTCCKSWQRNSEESCVDENLISHVLKLGET